MGLKLRTETNTEALYDVLKSDPCGIETQYIDEYLQQKEELKSDPCGIETQYRDGVSPCCDQVKIRPLWDWNEHDFECLVKRYAG